MAEKKMNIYERLANVQKVLKAPKGNYNSFGKYKYRSAEDILEAAKPLCVDNGLLLVLSDEPVISGDWHYIKATATVYDTTGEVKEPISNTAYARESADKRGMDASQITGTASSYARKYALNGLFLIDDTKDADTDEYTRQTNEKAPQSHSNNQTSTSSSNTGRPVREAQIERVTPEEASALYNIMTDNQRGWVLSHFKVKSFAELDKKTYANLVNQMKAHDEAKSEDKSA